MGERADGIIRCFRARERNVIERYGQRWLRVSYSATSDGGTVVAIVDVTDLLGREHELEAINRRIKAYAEASVQAAQAAAIADATDAAALEAAYNDLVAAAADPAAIEAAYGAWQDAVADDAAPEPAAFTARTLT